MFKQSLLAIGLLSSAAATTPDTWEMAEGFMVGGLNYTEEQIVMGNMQFCKDDLETVLVDVAGGIEHLTELDMEGLTLFVDSLGAAFYKFEEVLADCDPFTKLPNAPLALHQLSSMHAIFAKPDSFSANLAIRDLKINNLSLWHDLLDSSKDALEGYWGNAGYFLGRAARKVITGND